jgi:flagellar capping protein FliD
MSELSKTLHTDVEVRANTLKTALDNLVGYLHSVRADIAKCEAELADKRRLADQQISLLREQIARLQSDRASAEQQLAQVRKDIERERREIGMERQRLLRTIDQVFGSQAA